MKLRSRILAFVGGIILAAVFLLFVNGMHKLVYGYYATELFRQAKCLECNGTGRVKFIHP